jgi:hypothetical protein
MSDNAIYDIINNPKSLPYEKICVAEPQKIDYSKKGGNNIHANTRVDGTSNLGGIIRVSVPRTLGSFTLVQPEGAIKPSGVKARVFLHEDYPTKTEEGIYMEHHIELMDAQLPGILDAIPQADRMKMSTHVTATKNKPHINAATASSKDIYMIPPTTLEYDRFASDSKNIPSGFFPGQIDPSKSPKIPISIWVKTKSRNDNNGNPQESSRICIPDTDFEILTKVIDATRVGEKPRVLKTWGEFDELLIYRKGDSQFRNKRAFNLICTYDEIFPTIFIDQNASVRWQRKFSCITVIAKEYFNRSDITKEEMAQAENLARLYRERKALREANELRDSINHQPEGGEISEEEQKGYPINDNNEEYESAEPFTEGGNVVVPAPGQATVGASNNDTTTGGGNTNPRKRARVTDQ